MDKEHLAVHVKKRHEDQGNFITGIQKLFSITKSVNTSKWGSGNGVSVSTGSENTQQI